MSNTVTFEQVEQLALQLPPHEQLRMIARITQQLSQQIVSEPVEGHLDFGQILPP
jgi:hypothetical protein